MVKHPTSRAERLRLKRLKFDEKKVTEDNAGNVRRRKKEELRQQEIESELRNFREADLRRNDTSAG